MKNLFVLAALVLGVAGARGQSINCDLNIADEVPLGGGVPSDSFGGAANQPGRWNSVYVIGSSPMLLGLDGTPTSVSLTIAASNQSLSGGGFANPANTGDYARLLNDARYVDGLWASWTFHGLTNGHYRTVVYAVRPFPIISEAKVSINGGPVASVFGPMPGNQLILGVTHAVRDAVVTDGTLVILVSRNGGEVAACNGFQITAVPEPNSFLLLTLAIGGLLLQKRSTRPVGNIAGFTHLGHIKG